MRLDINDYKIATTEWDHLNLVYLDCLMLGKQKIICYQIKGMLFM